MTPDESRVVEAIAAMERTWGERTYAMETAVVLHPDGPHRDSVIRVERGRPEWFVPRENKDFAPLWPDDLADMDVGVKATRLVRFEVFGLPPVYAEPGPLGALSPRWVGSLYDPTARLLRALRQPRGSLL